MAHERLTRICFIDYDREMALVAERRDPATGEREILGVGRLSSASPAPTRRNSPSWSMTASSARGWAPNCCAGSSPVGREEKLGRITGHILRDNPGMLRTCAKMGFQTRMTPDDSVAFAEIAL